MNFQEELQSNLRQPIPARNEQERQLMITAQAVYDRIRAELLEQAKQDRFTVNGGMAAVECVVCVPQQYLMLKREDNYARVMANQKRILFRDPRLKANVRMTFDYAPELREEFGLFAHCLGRLAMQEGIMLEYVLYDPAYKRVEPFPGVLEGLDYLGYHFQLAVRARAQVAYQG